MSSKNEIDQEKIRQAISKTGFELEYKVTKVLEKNNWNVINSKYYIDDISENIREVDLIAYKTLYAKFYDVYVYTTLLISCKKSEKNHWGFFCKKKRPDDPNMNWRPVDNWTNFKAIEYQLENADWKDEYLSGDEDLKKEIFEVQDHIFAFQELNKQSFSVQNDKAIYSSITSLFKALGYEIKNLPERKDKQKYFYNFNLLSVADTDLIRINFEEPDIKSQKVLDKKYLGSFIVNKEEVFSRIHFIDWDCFEDKVQYYNQLHNYNWDFLYKHLKEFYTDIFSDYRKTEVYEDQFTEELNNRISRVQMFYDEEFTKIEAVSFDKNPGQALEIGIKGPSEKQREIFNSDSRINKIVNQLLKGLYLYRGEWKFAQWLPF